MLSALEKALFTRRHNTVLFEEAYLLVEDFGRGLPAEAFAGSVVEYEGTASRAARLNATQLSGELGHGHRQRAVHRSSTVSIERECVLGVRDQPVGLRSWQVHRIVDRLLRSTSAPISVRPGPIAKSLSEYSGPGCK